MLSNAQIDDIVSGKIPLSALTSAEKQRIIDLLDEKTQRLQADTAKIDLIPFAHAVYPGVFRRRTPQTHGRVIQSCS